MPPAALLHSMSALEVLAIPLSDRMFRETDTSTGSSVTRTPDRPDAITRRAFVQKRAASLALVSAPLVIPARLLGARAPSNRVRIGHIGAGRIAQGHGMPGVAGADLDHQHAEVALRALYAGKDVHLQKPFTMTHAEGIVLRKAVAKTGRILQVGSQQRSWGPNEQFRKAVELVRSGRVGNLRV